MKTEMLAFIPILVLIPITMIIVSVVIMKCPYEPNGLVGYRTSRSTASEEAWYTAQVYFGKVCLISNIILLIATIISAVLILPRIDGDNEDTTVLVILLITGVQAVVIFADIAATEIMLSKKFDKNGKPK